MSVGGRMRQAFAQWASKPARGFGERPHVLAVATQLGAAKLSTAPRGTMRADSACACMHACAWELMCGLAEVRAESVGLNGFEGI